MDLKKLKVQDLNKKEMKKIEEGHAELVQELKIHY